jgi:hypothetical protein
MTPEEGIVPQPPSPDPQAPDSFFAAYTALQHMTRAAHAAHDTPAPAADPEVDTTLDALILLRELRGQIAGWEASLIETARDAGASWASLARPLGVNSRQAAERRYLRLRPGAPGTTGDQRAQAVRDERAEQRSLTAWARTHAGELRRLAGQVTALSGLPQAAQPSLERIRRALGESDAAELLTPLTEVRSHLPQGTALARDVHSTLAAAEQRAPAHPRQ